MLKLLLALTMSFGACTGDSLTTKDYNVILSEVSSRQMELANSYKSSSDKGVVIDSARQYILRVLTKEIFPSWFGTPWDFNGTTTEPGKGSIACGYFVTTTLEDAGFILPRVRWAQLASESMIVKMTSDVKRYSNVDIETVEEEVLNWGKGLYVVGLDNHVGFLVNDGERVTFVHSNYYHPQIGVMEEDINSHNPCKDSRYRVIGKILGDEMMRKWLELAAL